MSEVTLNKNIMENNESTMFFSHLLLSSNFQILSKNKILSFNI